MIELGWFPSADNSLRDIELVNWLIVTGKLYLTLDLSAVFFRTSILLPLNE